MLRNHFKITMLGFGLIILSQGCAFLLGIKSPEAISKAEAKDYLIKHKIDTVNTLFLNTNYWDTLRSKPFKPDWQPGLRPIQFKVFNTNGDLVSQYASCEGSLKKTKFFDQFPPKNITPLDSTYTLYDEQKMIENFVPDEGNNDYTTIIYWATYTGLPGRKLIQKIEKQLKLENIKSSIYKLNVDNIEH